MSNVNRNSHKIITYTNTVVAPTVSNLEQRLRLLQMYMDYFELEDVEDPNLKNSMRALNENIADMLSSVQQLQAVNERLEKESTALINVLEDDTFMIINTESVNTALREALVNVDNFNTFVSNYIDSLVTGIKNRVIQGALTEFNTKVSEKLNALIQQQQQLSKAAKPEGNQANPQQAEQLNAKIDRLKRCLAAADTYEKRLTMICSEMEPIKNAAYSLCNLIRRIHSRASFKIQAIEQAVNH